MSRSALPSILVLVLFSPLPAADDIPPNRQYLEFLRQQAAELRKNDRPPATKEEWAKQEAELRKNLFAAWGGEACFLPKPCDLDPQQHGEPLKRDGYTVDKITFQTRPGVRMTANLYLPDAAKKKKAPAILMVHGHWRGAKQDPVVQLRCIGAAKLGFVVLCVDAFGAGERGVGTALGEYHGDMTAATLLPLGTPLSGLQVYENMRAVDYLETRPEVDKDQIGITGASGGGNQTMYAGAWDKRFKCVVPVCSVGTYQSYLGQACCMCEVVPGALRFTEEWGVLALTAPRPLMVVNATKDAIQFSVGEAKKSLALTAPVYKLLGKPDNLRHAIFDGPHDYSKAMREAMYGFMTLHLKGEGNGDPIPEPAIKTEDPEDLRCYPGDTRPKDFMTIPKFAAREGRRLREAKPEHKFRPDHYRQRAASAEALKTITRIPGEDDKIPIYLDFEGRNRKEYKLRCKSGIELPVFVELGKNKNTIVLLNLDGAEAARKSKLFASLKATGATIVTTDLRATGSLAVERDRVGSARDHNSSEWSLWLGTPLLGQWIEDARYVCMRAWADHLSARGEFMVIGEGPAGLVALGVAAKEKFIVRRVAAVNTIASFITDKPYVDQRLGIIAPGFLRDFGDVPHFAALTSFISWQKCYIAGGVSADGRVLNAEQLAAAYAPATHHFNMDFNSESLILTTPDNLLKELGLTKASEK
jgi:dienelactone hydrolase